MLRLVPSATSSVDHSKCMVAGLFVTEFRRFRHGYSALVVLAAGPLRSRPRHGTRRTTRRCSFASPRRPSREKRRGCQARGSRSPATYTARQVCSPARLLVADRLRGLALSWLPQGRAAGSGSHHSQDPLEVAVSVIPTLPPINPEQSPSPGDDPMIELPPVRRPQWSRNPWETMIPPADDDEDFEPFSQAGRAPRATPPRLLQRLEVQTIRLVPASKVRSPPRPDPQRGYL